MVYNMSYKDEVHKSSYKTRRSPIMKKFLAFLLTLMMLISGMSFALAEDITLDVIPTPMTGSWAPA